MKRASVTITEKKYLLALKSFYERLNNGEKLTFTDFVNEYKACRRFCKVMTDKGIVKNVGTRPHPVYKWNTVEPNIRMVRAILIEVRKICRDLEKRTKMKEIEIINEINNKKEVKVKPFTMPKKTGQKTETVRVQPRMFKENGKPTSQAINSKEIVLFWGLVKINIKTK
jgi:hypothetical protein